MGWAETRLIRRRAQDQPCVHGLLREEATAGLGLRSGFTEESVCRGPEAGP